MATHASTLVPVPVVLEPVPVPVFLGPSGPHTLNDPATAMADGPVAEVLLKRLEAADGGLDSADLAAELGVEHQAVVGAVKSLQALGEVSWASSL